MMTKERELLRQMVDAFSGEAWRAEPLRKAIAEAEAILAQEPESAKVEVWKPPRAGWAISFDGTIHESGEWGIACTRAGSVLPTKETAENARDASIIQRRILAYIAYHWPKVKQPKSYAEMRGRVWWCVSESGDGWYPNVGLTYLPGLVYIHTEAQARQICDDIKSGRLVL